MPRGQVLQFGFRGGIDEKTDPKQAPPGTLTQLVNSRQNKTGRIDRRYGSTATWTLAGITRLFSRQTEQCAIAGGKLYSYSAALAAGYARDYVPECTARRDPVKQFSSQWVDPDVSYGCGLEIWAWATNDLAGGLGSIYALVRDANTGATILQTTRICGAGATCNQPRVTVIGTTAIVWWGDPNSGAPPGIICAATLNLTSPSAWSAPVSVRTDPDVSSGYVVFDVFATDSSNVVLFYWSTQATKLQLYRYNASLVQQANSGVVDASAGWSALALAADAGKTALFIGTGQNGAAGGKLRFGVRDASTLASVVAVADLRTPGTVQSVSGIGIAAISSSDALVLGCWANPNLNPTEAFAVTSGGAATSTGVAAWVKPTSRVFVYGASYYCTAMKGICNTQYLVNWAKVAVSGATPVRPVAVLGPRVAGNDSGSGAHNIGHLASVPTVSSGGFITPMPVIAEALTRGRVGLERARYDFVERWPMGGDAFASMRSQVAELGMSAHISGGMPVSYDGQGVVECAFLETPDAALATLTPAGAGGGLFGPATYLYSFYWEWADAQGQIHRSNPSPQVSVVTAGAGNVNKVTIVFPTLSFTMRGGSMNPTPQPYLVVCRSIQNGPAMTLYRVTMPDTVATANLNDPTVATLTIVDTLGDGTLITHPLLYTKRGELENVCPPALRGLITHRNRLFGVGDDGKTVWASTQYVTGEAPRWNEILTMQFEEEIVALASLDDKLIAFADHGIWVVYGDGPNDQGIQNDWTTPMPVSTEVGCVCPQSVIRMSDGIYFQSRRGFYVLQRNLELRPLKAPEDRLAAYPVITAVTDLLQTEAVMWAAQATISSSTGIRLVFDDLHDVWGWDTMHDGATSGVAVSALATFGGVLYWSSAAKLLKEDPTTWLDAWQWFDSSWETAWISSAGSLGFQRVRKVQALGARLTNHDFKLSLAFDYGSYVQTYQFTAAQLSAKGSDVVQMRVGAQNGANPRCRAIRIKGEVLTPTNPGSYPISTGQGAQFSGIGLEIVPKPSMPRVGAAVQA